MSQPQKPSYNVIKGGSAAGPSKAKSSGAGQAKAKSKYALDAGDLLSGILSETQTEAAHEEQQLEQTLAKRADVQQHRQEVEAERRKREAEEALAAERDRQDRARARRAAVLQTMDELEAEQSAGTLTPSAQLPAVQGGPLDYATAVRSSASYAHPAVAAKRPVWVLPATIALAILLVGGGIVATLVLTSGPSLDPNSYPKSAMAVSATARNSLVTIGLRWVPTPEPPPSLAADETEAGEEATASRSRSRSRDRDRDRDRDSDTDSSSSSAPLDIEIDGSGIFDRGSE